MPREQQNISEGCSTVKKLFVGDLHEGINEESLRRHFSSFGLIVKIRIMKNYDGSFNKNYFFQESLVILHILYVMIVMLLITLFV